MKTLRHQSPLQKWKDPGPTLLRRPAEGGEFSLCAQRRQLTGVSRPDESPSPHSGRPDQVWLYAGSWRGPPITCLPTAGRIRLCPQLSAQSSMQTSSAWGSSGGCAPERAMGTVLERNTHPMSLAADPLPWSPRGLSSLRKRLAQNSMSPRPVGSYSSRSEGPEKNSFFLSFWCSSTPE